MTLDPQRRQNLLAWLQPPAGYRLEAGVGTAFSASLDVVAAAVLALVGEDHEPGAVPGVSLAYAVSRLQRRFRLFVNQGGLLIPSQGGNRMAALFDGFVRPVVLPAGAFHPKVWVLRFRARETPEMHGAADRFRVVCSSRNLTDARCWELGAMLEGEQARAAGVKALGGDLSAFFRQLIRMDSEASPSVRALCDVLSEVQFETDENVRLRWQWPGVAHARSLMPELPDAPARALVLSPFLRASVITRLARAGQLTLVSSQGELDALPDAAHKSLKPHRVFVLEDFDAEGPLGGDLHAKLYAFEDETAFTLLGSANATGPGWGEGPITNVEAMLRMEPGLPLARVLREVVEDKRGIHPWLHVYERRSVPEDADSRAKLLLDQFGRLVGSLQLSATYDAEARRLSLRLAQPERLTDLPDGLRLELAPYALAGSGLASAWCEISAQVSEVHFPDVDLTQVGAFVLLRACHVESGTERVFGLQVVASDLARFREGRDDALLRQALSSAEPTALLLRLLGQTGSGLSASSRAGSGKKGGGADSSALFEVMSVERVLEACTDDPGRVLEVESCLRTFGPLLDPAFLQFWEHFRRAFSDDRREVET
ncbi:phospholipase D family protein [Myxococcus qinghaiensis]|uniref:phospholipase D family protein n=1 Tax=Myxococcus qinghaiensis TaxID=2906758 RepID=UPI0020A827E1|nr:phospholipase D family protein [Myxococcus qinghaiensis]MCP3162638.1 phospholipase D family protein [Myxococcus qinghaiensis]